MPMLEPVVAFNRIKQDVDWCEERLASIQSPMQQHELEVENLGARLGAAWQQVLQNTDLSQQSRFQEEVQILSGELQLLELNHRLGFKDAKERCKREVDEVLITLCRKLWSTADILLKVHGSQVSHPPTPSDSDRDYSSEPQYVNDMSCIEERHRRKRRKGQCPQQTASAHESNTERTVHFNEVYQDGNASIKHIIVQWPPNQGGWFIIRCDEHDFNFKDSPLTGGMAHMRGRKHGINITYDRVVELLGTRVLGCDASLARRNNDIARMEFAGRSGYHRAENIEMSSELALPRSGGYAFEARATPSAVSSDGHDVRWETASEHAGHPNSPISIASSSQEVPLQFTQQDISRDLTETSAKTAVTIDCPSSLTSEATPTFQRCMPQFPNSMELEHATPLNTSWSDKETLQHGDEHQGHGLVSINTHPQRITDKRTALLPRYIPPVPQQSTFVRPPWRPILPKPCSNMVAASLSR